MFEVNVLLNCLQRILNVYDYVGSPGVVVDYHLPDDTIAELSKTIRRDPGERDNWNLLIPLCRISKL